MPHGNKIGIMFGDSFIKGNQLALKYKTREELLDRVKSYFEARCVYKDGQMFFDKPLSLGALAVHLNTTSKTIEQYSKRDDYGDIILEARNIIDAYYQERLAIGKNTAGISFLYQNAFKYKGWKDARALGNTLNLNIDASKTIEERESNIEKLKAAAEKEGVQ